MGEFMKRGKIIFILILMCITISVLVYSFAYTTTTHTSDDSSYLVVSEISFGLTDSVESISLGNQTPTIDKFGLLNESFSFSVENTSGKEQQYSVRLIDAITSTISNNFIRYQLTRNGVAGDVKTLADNGIIDSGVLIKDEVIQYSIIVWLNYDAEITNGTWEKVIRAEVGVVNIDTSGANEPMLLDNMIPIYYDNTDEVWRKADRTNSNVDYQWYDYDDRMWANAVTVYSTSETDYVSATEGTEISIDDITMFYVWIPRFKYDLFESGSPKEINVTFEQGIENTGTMKCNIINGVESCSGEKVSYTHPAFTFDGEELTGYWVSKFELSPESSTTCYSNVNTTNCNMDDLSLTSKPNQKSLVNISIGNLFKSIRNMEISGNIYGFINGGTSLNDDGTGNGDNNNYDIHLWKNNESAALAYLTYSKYGKYTNISFDDDNKELYNNNSSTKTGSSYVNSITYEYNIDYYGTGASTTGNIYGVYDLNGKVYEYAMANVLKQDGTFNEYNTSSGFSTSPNSKYYNAYAYASSGNSYYGDAMSEFVGFTSVNSAIPNNNFPFASRESVVAVERSRGATSSTYGGRAVITVLQDVYITKW